MRAEVFDRRLRKARVEAGSEEEELRSPHPGPLAGHCEVESRVGEEDIVRTW